MRIADGKHFLDIVIRDAEISARIVCRAHPETDHDAACRMAPDAPLCFVKEQWSSLSTDMLKTPHFAIHEIHVWAAPLPIIYEGEGHGEDYEDWVIPDIDHPTFPKVVKDAYDAVMAQAVEEVSEPTKG